jgi:hypothetical protein
MANSYYSIRIDSAANTLTDFKTALTAKYGAYHVDTNPTGVTYVYDTSPYLIFTCTALSDKHIRLYVASSHLWSYGTGYTSGNNVDGPVTFGGTYNGSSATAVHLIAGTNVFFVNMLQGNINSKIVVIGKLTNNDYGVLGLIGSSSATYNANTYGMNTTDGTKLYPVALDTAFQSAAGKLYKQRLILRNGAVGTEFDGDGSIASFSDIYNVSFVNGASTITVGATYLISTSSMYFNDGSPVSCLGTSIIAEFTA